MIGRVIRDDKLETLRTDAEIRKALADSTPVWIQLEKQCVEEDALLIDVLGIHPLTVEDIWKDRTAPKLEDYRKYLYIIVHAVKGAKRVDLELVELDVVVGKNFIVTHDIEGEITREVVNDLERDPYVMQKGPAWIAHTMLDRAVDRYLPVVDELDNHIEALTNDALNRAGTPKGPAVLRRILRYKRLMQNLRRMSVHQREVFLRVARGEFEEIPREVVPFFRDVYDHFLRVNDLIESYRDLVTSALDAYLTVQSNRMNEVMKTLTMISTVMLPLTFIAGVYGMNFEHMPELKWDYGYPFALAVMAAIAIGILFFFRRKRWLGNQDIPVDDEPPTPPRRVKKRTTPVP